MKESLISVRQEGNFHIETSDKINHSCIEYQIDNRHPHDKDEKDFSLKQNFKSFLSNNPPSEGMRFESPLPMSVTLVMNGHVFLLSSSLDAISCQASTERRVDSKMARG